MEKNVKINHWKHSLDGDEEDAELPCLESLDFWAVAATENINRSLHLTWKLSHHKFSNSIFLFFINP